MYFLSLYIKSIDSSVRIYHGTHIEKTQCCNSSEAHRVQNVLRHLLLLSSKTFILHWVYWKKSNAKQNTAILLERQSQKTHKIKYNLLSQLNWFSALESLPLPIQCSQEALTKTNTPIWIYDCIYRILELFGLENFKSLHKLLRIDLQICLYITLYTTSSLKTVRL